MKFKNFYTFFFIIFSQLVLGQEKVIGVISEGDILSALLANTDIHAPLEGWVSHDFKFLSSQDYKQALNLMIE